VGNATEPTNSRMSFRETTNRPLSLPRTPNSTERLLRRIFLDHWNLKLLALAITLGLWFAVNGQRSPVTERFPGVQLNFKLPEGTGISNNPRDEIELTLTGAQRDLDLVNPRDLNALIDLTDRRPGDRVVQLNPGRLKIALPAGVSLQKVQPASIELRLEPMLERELEVETKLEGKPAMGYEVSGITVNPQKVRARGPASHMTAVARAFSETVLLDGHTEDFSVPQLPITVPDQRITLIDNAVDVVVHIRSNKLTK